MFCHKCYSFRSKWKTSYGIWFCCTSNTHKWIPYFLHQTQEITTFIKEIMHILWWQDLSKYLVWCLKKSYFVHKSKVLNRFQNFYMCGYQNCSKITILLLFPHRSKNWANKLQMYNFRLTKIISTWDIKTKKYIAQNDQKSNSDIYVWPEINRIQTFPYKPIIVFGKSLGLCGLRTTSWVILY